MWIIPVSYRTTDNVAFLKSVIVSLNLLNYSLKIVCSQVISLETLFLCEIWFYSWEFFKKSFSRLHSIPLSYSIVSFILFCVDYWNNNWWWIREVEVLFMIRNNRPRPNSWIVMLENDKHLHDQLIISSRYLTIYFLVRDIYNHLSNGKSVFTA